MLMLQWILSELACVIRMTAEDWSGPPPLIHAHINHHHGRFGPQRSRRIDFKQPIAA